MPVDVLSQYGARPYLHPVTMLSPLTPIETNALNVVIFQINDSGQIHHISVGTPATNDSGWILLISVGTPATNDWLDSPNFCGYPSNK